MHRLSLYEDCIQLDIPVNRNLIKTDQLPWKQYNPRKVISRYGCSITSLDGGDSGELDLDSLLESNKINGTDYTEKDFTVPTQHAKPFNEFLSMFECGRSHYLKLEPGGFFPWHRDVDPSTFRIIYTINNCTPDQMVWLEDDKILPLENNSWYYINTRKKHALFSFGQSTMAVFNVLANTNNLNLLKNYFKIK